MRRLLTVTVLVAVLVLVLAAPAMSAPKETRTICNASGQEEQINANRSLPKGATEGACVDLEQLCLEQIPSNSTTFVPPNQCYYEHGNMQWFGEGVVLTGNPMYLATYDPATGAYGPGALQDWTVEACSDLESGLRLENSDPRCSAPPPDPDTSFV